MEVDFADLAHIDINFKRHVHGNIIVATKNELDTLISTNASEKEIKQKTEELNRLYRTHILIIGEPFDYEKFTALE